jgi:hypothetical protein
VFADFVDGANIWMVQGGSRLCLTVEAAQSLCVWREPVRKELQGNEAVELGVLSFVDDTHPAATELFNNAVVRDVLPDHAGKPYLRRMLGRVKRQVNRGAFDEFRFGFNPDS